VGRLLADETLASVDDERIVVAEIRQRRRSCHCG
jgi:hypothetical protein